MTTFSDIALHVPSLLLPAPGVDPTLWAVVACDQYTSQPEYWRRVEQRVGDHPSTLRLILPEAFLGTRDCPQRITAIVRAMRQYVREGVLTPVGPGFVRVERRTSRGAIRRGLIVALDLDAYDFRRDAHTLIRPSEETVAERLPPRAAIRRRALLEVPHVMVLIDDPRRTVIEPLFDLDLPLLYDFELMEGGGHVRGALVNGVHDIRRVAAALRALASPLWQKQRYGVAKRHRALYVVGDGNHSFATAKVVWERIRARTRNRSTLQTHPARYALVELVNIHDPGLDFQAIHRVVRSVDTEALLVKMKSYYEARGSACRYEFLESQDMVERELRRRARRSGHRLAFATARRCGILEVSPPLHALPVGTLQAFLDECSHGGTGLDVDYIHGEKALRELTAHEYTIGFLLPPVNRKTLFRTVVVDGALPRKTFSMGGADDKRYYMECRMIVPDKNRGAGRTRHGYESR